MYPLAALSYAQPRFIYNPIVIIHVMHSRRLWSCAELRRAAARRGEAPLVYYNIRSSREIEDFVKTPLCKLCVILRWRVLLCVSVSSIKNIGRLLPLELPPTKVDRVMFTTLFTDYKTRF